MNAILVVFLLVQFLYIMFLSKEIKKNEKTATESDETILAAVTAVINSLADLKLDVTEAKEEAEEAHYMAGEAERGLDDLDYRVADVEESVHNLEPSE